jgi:hypothetical protein
MAPVYNLLSPQKSRFFEDFFGRVIFGYFFFSGRSTVQVINLAMVCVSWYKLVIKDYWYRRVRVLKI